MRIKIWLLLLLCLPGITVYSQADHTRTDAIALQLPESQAATTQGIADYINAHFTTEPEKVRAAFIWTASNIRYDVENMYVLNPYEKREEKIAKALKTKKGICEHYAAIFTEVCVKCGISAYLVEGYTRQNGKTDQLPHAWSAVKVNGEWRLFDPTWSAGYVNNGAYVRKLNEAFYNVGPAVLIRSHMPFDPLWEFLPYHVTNEDFLREKTTVDRSHEFFSTADTLKVFEQQNDIEKLSGAGRRIEENGIKNSLLFDKLAHIKNAIEVLNQNEKVYAHNAAIDKYNMAVADFNEGVSRLNTFIQYRNRQFTPRKPDAEIQDMVDAAGSKIAVAKNTLDSIKKPDQATASLIITLQRSVMDAWAQVDEQKRFLTTYFSKGKAGRKAMFYKYTWFGVPVN